MFKTNNVVMLYIYIYMCMCTCVYVYPSCFFFYLTIVNLMCRGIYLVVVWFMLTCHVL